MLLVYHLGNILCNYTVVSYTGKDVPLDPRFNRNQVQEYSCRYTDRQEHRVQTDRKTGHTQSIAVDRQKASFSSFFSSCYLLTGNSISLVPTGIILACTEDLHMYYGFSLVAFKQWQNKLHLAWCHNNALLPLALEGAHFLLILCCISAC